MHIEPKNIKRILLIRLSALGDCVAALPVYAALREAFPDAHIAWAIQDNNAPLLKNLPGLDEVIIYPRQRWKKMKSWWQIFQEARKLRRHLRKRRFDITIDVQSNTKSGALAFCSSAPIRVCHGKGEAKELALWLNNTPIENPENIVNIYQKNICLLSPLNLYPKKLYFPLMQDKIAHASMYEWISKHSINKKKFVLLVPFCSKTQKEWGGERYQQLAEALNKKGIPVVFSNGPGIEEETRALLPQQSETSFLSPQTSILELVELIRLAGVVVGGDTGPVHISGAIKTPTVVIFGPTNPKRFKPVNQTAIHHTNESVDNILEDVLRFYNESN